MSKTKYTVTALTIISLGGVAFTAGYEGFRANPYYDTGKVVTIGYGSTVKPDGSKVKITDPPIDKKTGMEYLRIHMNKDAQRFNKSLQGVKLSQDEYDLYMDFTYQFGTGAWSGSSMLRYLKAGKYVQACKSLEPWRFSRVKGVKVDCRINRGCTGVWTRQKARIDKCLGAN